MAIGAIEKMGNRTAESWQAVLSHFPKLRYVISDLARGLIKGVQLSGHLLHQGDLFHFFRDVGRTTQQLERHLQRLLKEENRCLGQVVCRTNLHPDAGKRLSQGRRLFDANGTILPGHRTALLSVLAHDG